MRKVLDTNIVVCISSELRDTLRVLAASKGLSLAAYARMAMLAYPEVSAAVAPIIVASPQPKTVEVPDDVDPDLEGLVFEED